MKYFLGVFIVFSLFYHNVFWNYKDFYDKYYDRVNIFLEKKSNWDIYKQKIILDNFLNSFEIKNKNHIFIKKLLDSIYDEILNKIEKFESTTQKVLLGYSEWQKEIYWYFRWNPKWNFIWVFANIHWWYEYWTYLTAMYLIKELEKQNKKNWFIIPTLNPDWLEIAKKDNFSKLHYVSGRWNKNKVDLNRNFCTSDFSWWEYVKYALFSKEKTELSKWFSCNSQAEVKIVLDVLNNYKFDAIIDIHSAWWIFFIPDYSIDDDRVINLWNKLKKSLWNDYKFNLVYKDEDEKLKKIKLYEIDDRWKDIYTWTMVNYIYENFNIPTILVELKKHWEVEKNLIKFFE